MYTSPFMASGIDGAYNAGYGMDMGMDMAGVGGMNAGMAHGMALPGMGLGMGMDVGGFTSAYPDMGVGGFSTPQVGVGMGGGYQQYTGMTDQQQWGGGAPGGTGMEGAFGYSAPMAPPAAPPMSMPQPNPFSAAATYQQPHGYAPYQPPPHPHQHQHAPVHAPVPPPAARVHGGYPSQAGGPAPPPAPMAALPAPGSALSGYGPYSDYDDYGDNNEALAVAAAHPQPTHQRPVAALPASGAKHARTYFQKDDDILYGAFSRPKRGVSRPADKGTKFATRTWHTPSELGRSGGVYAHNRRQSGDYTRARA